MIVPCVDDAFWKRIRLLSHGIWRAMTNSGHVSVSVLFLRDSLPSWYLLRALVRPCPYLQDVLDSGFPHLHRSSDVHDYRQTWQITRIMHKHGAAFSELTYFRDLVLGREDMLRAFANAQLARRFANCFGCIWNRHRSLSKPIMVHTALPGNLCFGAPSLQASRSRVVACITFHQDGLGFVLQDHPFQRFTKPHVNLGWSPPWYCWVSCRSSHLPWEPGNFNDSNGK
jgi:hypothetical protein